MLVVPDDTAVVQRRDLILDLLAQGRTPESGSQYTAAQFEAAKSDPVVLGSQADPHWVAPHFVWAVRDELTAKLCGVDAETCTAMENGGLRITTTLDAGLQKIAEKWVQAAAIVPHAKNPAAAAKALGFKSVEPWMTNLRSKNLRNSALVALDYQTGELVAYVGSANYYATSSNPQFQPQYDVVGKGFRQPGSAFKPFNYAVAIDDKKLTAGSMLMDVGTTFAGNYSPSDADNLERGPVRVRNALQFSLNIPAVKAMGINGPDRVFGKAAGLRHELPGQANRRPRARARCPGGPPRRPGDGLRDARQRRQGDPPHDDPDHQGRPGKGRRRPVPAAGTEAGRQPAGGLGRDRHPRGQH